MFEPFADGMRRCLPSAPPARSGVARPDTADRTRGVRSAGGFAGTVLGLGMVFVYIVISIGVIRFYLREHRDEFSLLRHGILPVLTALIMVLPVYGQLHPAPAYPNNLAIWLLLAWMVVGVGYLVHLRSRRPHVVSAMGAAFGDAAEPVADATPAGDRGCPEVGRPTARRPAGGPRNTTTGRTTTRCGMR
jgi:hypothetical protein